MVSTADRIEKVASASTIQSSREKHELSGLTNHNWVNQGLLAEEMYRCGVRAAEDEMYNCAIELFKSALEKEPDNVEFLTAAGRAAHALEKYESEAGYLSRRLQRLSAGEHGAVRDLGLAEDYNKLGMYYHKQKDLARAIACFIDAVEADKRSTDGKSILIDQYYYNAGLAQLAYRNEEAAAQYFAEAIASALDNFTSCDREKMAEYYTNLGRACERSGDMQKAANSYRMVLEYTSTVFCEGIDIVRQ